MQFQCTLFITKNATQIEINIGRQQKQVIDTYVHLLKALFLKGSPPKRLFLRFYPMDLYSYDVYYIIMSSQLNHIVQ